MLFPEIYSKPVMVTKLPWTVGLPARETEAQTGSLTAQQPELCICRGSEGPPHGESRHRSGGIVLSDRNVMCAHTTFLIEGLPYYKDKKNVKSIQDIKLSILLPDSSFMR